MSSSRPQRSEAAAPSHAGPGVDSDAMERPVGAGGGNAAFGSDPIAEVLRDLDIPFLALNPGASYRGLHDSLVNHLGNERPQMLLCLHEEHAVAIAHGYAKVTDRPMGAVVHSNVGLMHATMAIFNAWCDRAPVLVLGATGPVDAAKRRPWIDWIHTAADQGALVRSYVKWDAQPASVEAAREALLRAFAIADTAPKGPTYVNIDAAVQEAPLTKELPVLEVRRYGAPKPAAPDPTLLDEALAALADAKSPVILVGRVGRGIEGWEERIAVAKALDARVLTDLKTAASFPTDHPLHAAPPGLFPRPEALDVLRGADVILSLDWIDLAGTLSMAFGKEGPAETTVIQATLDPVLHNGWSQDHQGLPPVDIDFRTDPDAFVTALAAKLQAKASSRTVARQQRADEPATADRVETAITVDVLGRALRRACGSREVSLLRAPLSWNGGVWPFRHPLDYLGYDGGGGVGSGPGMAVGSALALRGSGRLPVAILGDGDTLMGVTALWTAAHYRVPLLVVVANNQSFFNDEIHQDRVARMRGRPPENRWIGQRIADPDLDFVKLAEGQGGVGFGPVRDPADLAGVFARAIAEVEAGRVVVVDVRVEPGYDPATQSAIARAE
jgi:thiamine pyrophosphate-dependent acetolactate synthase large subunit-like protein